MNKTEKDIEEFFQEIIFGFIYSDIGKCIKVGANYVAALALLSYTEFIGGLISGNLGSRNKSRENFKEALKHFPKGYKEIDAKITVEYKDENSKTQIDEGIYGVYRCGMVHEYFPKGRYSTVINCPNGHADENIIGIRVINLEGNPNNKITALLTNEYFRDFKEAVKKIHKDLVTGRDPKLLEGFNKSLDTYNSRKVVS